MGYKKAGFGKGKISGFGGKVEVGESIVQAAKREMFEESAIQILPRNFAQVGLLNFIFPGCPSWSQQVHVFFARNWNGHPRESDEMIPLWFNVAEIPFSQMWDDGRYWLPVLLDGRSIRADFTFAYDNAAVDTIAIREMVFDASSLGRLKVKRMPGVE